jgi:ATP-dependent Clp protease protease subunit
MLTIHMSIVDAIAEHAQANYPYPVCGFVAGPIGSDRPERFVPLDNIARSTTFWEPDPQQMLGAYREMEARNEEPVVVYRSYTNRPAYPSRIDIAYAAEEITHHLFVSTQNPEFFEFCSYRIVDGWVEEETVEIIQSRARVVLLYGDIDDDMANRAISEMLLLASEDPTANISLLVNSPGGSVSAGMAIYDTMKLVEAPVATWAMGMAAGMAQVLLTAGAPGERFALPQARIALMRLSAPAGEQPTGTAVPAKTFARWRRQIMQLTAAATGQPVEQVIADSEQERQFSAHEAVEYGLVDHVVPPPPVSDGNGAT